MEAFSLLFSFSLELYFREFTDAIDEVGNGPSKTTADLPFSYTRVFDNVMQQSSHETFMIHAHVG